ncbi:FG-GAP repeat domain-containing protein [Nannocystis bainbridge]|uniref:VCBS repeat-containing protein n=1 Tax=Nannocystis bainbridge TaxID=2995303 RepID=A0ABT5DZ18_9BACT|nr:VCBS repeat-containing protein [Nannocystis bainbridge]MDC0718393.1 VCBS repeat-containing protein [Nannocystis bainbridge]
MATLAIACSTAASAIDTDGGPTGNATGPATSLSTTDDPGGLTGGGTEGTTDGPAPTTGFDPTGSPEGTTGGTTGEPPAPSCDGGGGSALAAEPVLAYSLKDRWEEAWLGSPAVADLDLDGAHEVIVPRGQALLAWAADGEVLFKFEAGGGRIWSSPVVADFIGGPELEIAFAARDQVYLLDRSGALAPGFPVTWEDELRSIAAGDLDGDGRLDIAVSVGRSGPTDVVHAWRGDGSPVPGFPPNEAGSAGCDDQCYLAGCYDQNLAVGDLDGDGKADLVAPHDNAYVSIHHGSGEAFDAADIFPVSKTPGVRYLHDLAEAMQGYADDEDSALQAHFTNTAPAIADLDGDGQREIVMLASVQNATQSDREEGVAVWVVGADASRRPGFETPVHLPDYLSGLWDYGDTNIVGITNQVAVADLRADHPGLEIVFVGFDGRVHAVSAAGQVLWSTAYTTDPEVAAGGVVIGDLSGDGAPEVVFNSYSTGDDKGALFVLGSDGAVQHQLPLPRRGAMPVPTLADVDGDGQVEIVVSLKDAEDMVESVRVYTVPGSTASCLLWPTGRGNNLRNGLVP